MNTTSSNLIRRIKADDPQAWCDVVQLYGPLVYAWCRRCGLDQEDASEVFQETFFAAWRGMDNFRRERAGDTFRGWLRAVTRSKILDFQRRNARFPRARGGTDLHVQLQNIATPDQEDDEGDLRALTLRGLDQLQHEFSRRDREVYVRFVIEHHTAQEVASEFQMKPGTVRMVKHRIQQRLRQILRDRL